MPDKAKKKPAGSMLSEIWWEPIMPISRVDKPVDKNSPRWKNIKNMAFGLYDRAWKRANFIDAKGKQFGHTELAQKGKDSRFYP